MVQEYSRSKPVKTARMKRVWLLKSSSDSTQNYVDCVTSLGQQATAVSVLDFLHINQDNLKDALSRPDYHSGLIFTSGRAVEVVYELYKNLPAEKQNAWAAKNTFAIGETTSGLVRKKLGLQPVGEHYYSAHELAQFIVKQIPSFEKPLLFPCSSIKKDDLPQRLTEKEIEFRALNCYETKCDPKLEQSLKGLLKGSGLADVLVFFSPSCVQFAVPILTSLKAPLSEAKLIAFGASTNAALVKMDLSVAGLCLSPTPDGLKETLKEL